MPKYRATLIKTISRGEFVQKPALVTADSPAEARKEILRRHPGWRIKRDRVRKVS